MSYPSAKSMADKVALGLSDPAQPTICPICLCDFAEDLHLKFSQHLPRLRVECHALWDACVGTITLQRTTEEIDLLRTKLAMNHKRCKRRDRDHHVRAHSAQAYYLHLLLESAGHIIKCALQLGEHSAAERALATKSFADKRGRWPARVEQLFPHGAQEAMEALLAYCELYISAGPLDVLAGMLVVARPVVFPVLLEVSVRARIVEIVVKMLDPVASGIGLRAPWLQRDHAARASTMFFLSSLVSGPGALPREELQFTAGHEPALLRVIAPVAQQTPETNAIFDWLASWCVNLAHRTGTVPPSRVARWLARQNAQRTRDRPPTFALVVRDIVLQAIGCRVCAGPGCTLSVLEKPLPACARCRVPRYCSRDCQRRDWRGEGAPMPHRHLCNVLAKIEAHRCPRLVPDEFEEVYARAAAQFDPVDMLMINSFVTSSGHEFGNTFREEQINTFPFVNNTRPMSDEEAAAAAAQHEELMRSGAFDGLEGKSIPVNFIMRL